MHDQTDLDNRAFSVHCKGGDGGVTHPHLCTVLMSLQTGTIDEIIARAGSMRENTELVHHFFHHSKP